MESVEVTVNGQQREIGVEPRRTLLTTIRNDLGLTGTKEVCEMGNCGACTVLVDDRAVYSCLLLAAECDGRRVDTIESLGDGGVLNPIQQAFVDCDALQCGFCTPGQVLSLEALRRRVDSPDTDQIVDSVSGNLCRCGAYRHILDAAHRALGEGSNEA